MILCEACCHGDPSVEPLIVLLIERTGKGNELSGCFDLVTWQGFGLMGHVVESPRFGHSQTVPGSIRPRRIFPSRTLMCGPAARKGAHRLELIFVGFEATDLHDLGKNPRHLQRL